MAKKKAATRANSGKKRNESAVLPQLSGAETGVEEAERSGLEEPIESEDDRFAVVAVGASAGGLEAFTQFLSGLPADTGMAYVFVQHLDPKHVSMLNELLQRQTTLPVLEVSEGMEVAPNQIYVIPRNTIMRIEGNVLKLSPRPATRVQTMPIDAFFQSLALDRKRRAIGVILSGNASDGSIGITAIKEEGGITFAQDTASARFDSMPRNAVASGCVDFVLPPEEIAREIVRLGRHPYVMGAAQNKRADVVPDGPEGLGRILALIRSRTGNDFAHYKQTTVRRRILRRMALKRAETMDRYAAKLRSEPAEVQALQEDILINVTQFFRDPSAFEALKESVFPQLTANRSPNSPIRIWVPGCSSGEEVYSLAMVLAEYLEEHSLSFSIQIFGTDIGETSLEKARVGTYGSNIVASVSADRLRRFFTKVDGAFQINKRLREMCIFARQSLAKDPPFSKLDLISCRNVLIYFDTTLQRRVIPIFHYALKPTGFLLLGCSETIGAYSDLFTLVSKKNKIYARVAAAARLPVEFSLADKGSNGISMPRRPEDWTEGDIIREADRIALSKYTPPGVVIDDDLNILQFRGQTWRYLEPASGTASLNLLKMMKDGFSAELRHCVNSAREQNTAVRREGLRLRRDGEVVELSIEVIPFKGGGGRGRLFLVVFETADKQSGSDEKKAVGARGLKLAVPALERENAQLRQDLTATKEYLQSVIEEQEASNEELRSANEEIQSSNEELQSTNEELETAKEELQSTNEELNTVNEELQTRNLQLTKAGDDLRNLLANVNIPILMLSNDLRIRRFTPVSERILNLIPSDVGRPISDIKFNIEIPNLRELLLDVIENLGQKTLEVRDWNNRPYSLRIRPYRTDDNKIEGVVMVLVETESMSLPVQGDLGAVLLPSELASAPDRLRVFARSLLSAQEDERRRVSRELHDDLNQKLALLELDVAGLERKPPPAAKLAGYLRSFRTKVSGLSDDLRRIAYQLHPSILDDLGLEVALESYCRDYSKREGIRVNFRHENVAEPLREDLALTVYRVLQEALRNVAKHSGASSVDVSLDGAGQSLKMEIIDTGSGFEVEEARGHGGLGLTSIEERVQLAGGSVQIRSHPGDGTSLLIQIPYSPEAS